MSEAADDTDTIAAISTAVGPGAIGIVRLSGPGSIGIAGKVFKVGRGDTLAAGETHRLLYGHVVEPSTGMVVDEALLAIMRKPRTYTREDVVEIHCHGGVAAQRAVLRLLLGAGARLAEPGEFTRRAFLNGRIDLAQAESVAAIIGARSSGALRASLRQLDGGLSVRVREVRGEVVGLLAGIETSVDFSDEDVEDVDWAAVRRGLEGVQGKLSALAETALVGRALEQGLRTAIVGKPNVGKSSLLNALLMRERAIVSEIPGTTRDTVEELMEIAGIPIHLVDTAGLRSGGDQVERLGVARSEKAMEQADLVLLVVDMSEEWGEAERGLLANVEAGRCIVVGNKIDLVQEVEEGEARLRRWVGRVADDRGSEDSRRWCVVSATTGEGVDELRAAIADVVSPGGRGQFEECILGSERQRTLVAEAAERVEAGVVGVADGAGEELVCEDLRGAVSALGRITGEDLTEDVLDEVFSRFCIGK